MDRPKEYDLSLGRSLYLIAKQEDKLPQYRDYFSSFMDLISSNKELREYLSAPYVKDEDAFALIDKAFGDKNVPHFASFLKLARKKRLVSSIKRSYKEFMRLSGEDLGIETGFVYSARPLDEKSLKDLEGSLSAKRHSKVELTPRIDASLIGGFRVYVGDSLYDSSYKSQLEKLNATLKEDTL